ncbi:subtilisin-like protease 3 [[Candida] jaroonii]|uniref:Subtilisin-like protease 3 n=1 Tax=[Candida] jaroonii TaxID=467808 RepID=A0ACA9YBH4_9ASCO|nr:subtilisin-like protease 3 [[Candida] jaroonii]
MKLLTYSLLSTTIAGLLIPNLEMVSQLLPSLELHDNQLSFGNVEADKPASKDIAPILNIDSLDDIIPDRYIIVFKDDVSIEEFEAHKSWILNEYQSMLESLNDVRLSSILKIQLKTNELGFFNIAESFKGYYGYLTEGLVEMIQKNPNVKYLEKDTKVKVNEFDIQKDAPWGLSRLSQRENYVSSSYEFDNEGGEGVTAYVIDTGIKVSMEEFEGRAVWGDSFAFPKLKLDGNGHGTHCAGIIGSKTYGVAKKVDLVAVGVMNFLGSGVTSDIIKGIEFVVNDHKAKVASKLKGFKGSVINMSLGGGAQESLDLAINAATNAGIHVAVAAGNDNQDACEYSPAKATGPITVGASNIRDEKASFSNWGKCVDIFAPGEEITSTYIVGETSVLSGTSMASPQIAGLLAYFLSLQPEIESEFSTGLLNPLDLKSKVIKYGTKGVIQGIIDPDTPNILAFNGAGQNLTSFWNL